MAQTEQSDEQKFRIQDEPEINLAGVSILLVEDNSLNIEIAKFVLESEDAVVKVAMNGQEAVQQFTQSEIGKLDLILMDIIMPVMDGLSATRMIRALEREDAKTIPIIAMTANILPEDIKKCMLAGMNAHIPKPLDVEKLFHIIALFLSKAD